MSKLSGYARVFGSLLFAIVPCVDGSVLAAQSGTQEADLFFTRQLLAGARGIDPLMCELALQSLDRGMGSWYGFDHLPDANIDQQSLKDWTSRHIVSGEVIPPLTDAMSSSDQCVRRVAARLFGRVRHREAFEALSDRLRNGNEQAREMAAVAFGFLENRDAVTALIRGLKDQASAVRRASAWALGQIEDKRAIDALTRVLEEDADASVRAQAARALGEIEG